MLTADDMRAEQQYIRERFRRHNRYLHGWGIVCGCGVAAPPVEAHPWQVKISPGYVITPRGDEILIPNDVSLDLAAEWRQPYDPCGNVVPCLPTSSRTTEIETKTVYLAVCYAECDVRPVRMYPAGCGCDDAACEYSRTREGFEFVLLDELPKSHQEAAKTRMAWINKLTPWLAGRAEGPIPVPDCSQYPDESCVVLATIELPKDRAETLESHITFDDCQASWSSAALMTAIVRDKFPFGEPE